MEVTYTREQLPLPEDLLRRMAETLQNPRYHSEGNVLEHTWFVLDRFRQLSSQFELSVQDQEVLYWAAVLHDTGKVLATRWEDGRWRSPGHERAGVPIAWDILLQHPEISSHQRQRILQLVRWHGFPLQFARTNPGINALKLLGTATDLRLLAIFNLFDLRGRYCDDRLWVDSVAKRFLELDAPQAEYEIGKYSDVQAIFSGMNLRMKNAVWTAYFKGMAELLPKLLEAPQVTDLVTFDKKVFMTVGPPLTGKSAWLSENLPDVFRISMDEHGMAEHHLDDRYYMDRKLVEFKHFLTVYLNRYKKVALDGCNLNTGFRHRLIEMIRGLGVEIEFVVFEAPLNTLKMRNEGLASPHFVEVIEEVYAMQDLLHPWEAHHTRFVANN